MPQYETTFILTPDLEEADLEKNIERYTGIITGGGGKIEKEERWGIRRMAYEIKKKTQGYYVHVLHDSGPNIPRELERQFLLNEFCLRYLTVRAEKPVPEPEPKKPLVKEAPAEAEPSGDKEPASAEAPTAEAPTAEAVPEPEKPQAAEAADTPPDNESTPNDEKTGA